MELQGSGGEFEEGSTYIFTCIQTGTTAVSTVMFLLNGHNACTVRPLDTCSFSPGSPCGCQSQSSVARVYGFTKTDMKASDAGMWTCSLPAVPELSKPEVKSNELSLTMIGE